jgi:hypothetical protein
VRVPAAYAIGAGGKLNPPVVSVPAFLAVQLTVASRDGSGHTVVVKTPTPHTLAVPANGRKSVLLPGLRAGQYIIDVDGKPGGSLTIGGEPGP